jgi:hypothetical protein
VGVKKVVDVVDNVVAVVVECNYPLVRHLPFNTEAAGTIL